MIYTGVGSRRTPQEVLWVMRHMAETFAEWGWIVRTGHAPGADQAFERGAFKHAEVYLPWRTFERTIPVLAGALYVRPTSEAIEIAQRFHPAWGELSEGARLLHARNVHAVLGPECDNPSSFVVCWTANGSLDGSERFTGGTGQALRIATAYAVPVFNLMRPGALAMAFRHVLSLVN